MGGILNIAVWPKVHLHVHLEGAIRPATILDLYRENGGAPVGLTLAAVRERAQMTPDDRSFGDFLKKFAFIMPCLRKPADLVRITREAVADADVDGVRYVELRFSPHYILAFGGIAPHAAIEAVLEGVHAAAADHPSVAIGLTLIIDQARGPEAGQEAVTWAAQYRLQGIGAIDIAGDPSVYPLEAYERACRLACERGLGVTVHAGETQGPDSVRVAIERLRATRIGHGIRAIEDPRVLDLVLTRGVTLEVSVSSNVYTGSVRSLNDHPLPHLLEAGVRATINTDDPGVFNLTLSDEYDLLQRTFGLTPDDFRQANLCGADAAFVDGACRTALYCAIEAGYSAMGG